MDGHHWKVDFRLREGKTGDRKWQGCLGGSWRPTTGGLRCGHAASVQGCWQRVEHQKGFRLGRWSPGPFPTRTCDSSCSCSLCAFAKPAVPPKGGLSEDAATLAAGSPHPVIICHLLRVFKGPHLGVPSGQTPVECPRIKTYSAWTVPGLPLPCLLSPPDNFILHLLLEIWSRRLSSRASVMRTGGTEWER